MRALPLLIASALVAGCSSAGASAIDARGDGGADSGTGDSGSTTRALDAEGCFVGADDPNPDAPCLRTVRFHAKDDEGADVAGLAVSVCGDVCIPGTTDATGKLALDVRRRMRRAGVQIHGYGTHATYVFRLGSEAGAGDVDLGDVRVPKLPPSTVLLPSSPTTAPTTVTSGDLTLSIPSGTSARIELELTTPEEQSFRVKEIPIGIAPPFVDPSLGLDALWAVAPWKTTFDPGVSVRLRNVRAYPAGTAVKLFAQDGDTSAGNTKPLGVLHEVAQGHVSEDGSVLVFDGGPPLSVLTWLAVRRAE
ncbi:MAG: hypothetical protein U0169_06650 [Polyangiaceae bacterium]